MRQINARERDLVCGGIGNDGAKQRIVPCIVIEDVKDESGVIKTAAISFVRPGNGLKQPR